MAVCGGATKYACCPGAKARVRPEQAHFSQLPADKTRMYSITTHMALKHVNYNNKTWANWYFP